MKYNIDNEDIFIKTSFIYGPYVEILSTENSNKKYFVEFINNDTNDIIYSTELNVNKSAYCYIKYLLKWKILVKFNNIIIYEHIFDLKNKNVFVNFGSPCLGDTLAYIGIVDEFVKKNKCKLYCKIDDKLKILFYNQYNAIEFVDSIDLDIMYAAYDIGHYPIREDGKVLNETDYNCNRTDLNKLPLQGIAKDILNIECEEIIPHIYIRKNEGWLTTPTKYICISTDTWTIAKKWNYKDGWKKITMFLNKRGYDVVDINKKKIYKCDGTSNDILQNFIDNNDNLQNIVTIISNCEFFIGTSSGLSWLAWGLNKKVILISGHTDDWYEFKTKCYRVSNKSVCHGCWHKFLYDTEDSNWCPEHKNTDRQFECTKKITPEMVISKINSTHILENKFDDFAFIMKRDDIFYKSEQFYTSLDVNTDKLENLGDIKDVSGDIMEIANKYGWARAIYHEIFNLHEYYKDGNQKRINEGDIVVDLGGNLGIFNRWAYHQGASKVISFEPDKRYFKLLSLNADPRSILFNAAISNEMGELNLYESSHLGGSNVFGIDGQEGYSVKTYTLNYLFESGLINHIDFLKVDIEGSEHLAFSGISDENLQKVKTIAMEYHNILFNFDDELRSNFIKKMNGLGFNSYIMFMGNDNALQMIYFWK